jgi:hypothetical protein
LVYNIPNCKALFAIHDVRDLEAPSTADFVVPKKEKPRKNRGLRSRKKRGESGATKSVVSVARIVWYIGCQFASEF